MATEVLLISRIDIGDGWTGSNFDIDEGIAAADGLEMSTTSDGESEDCILGVGLSSLTDADTITRVDIEVRGRVTTDGGDETFDVQLRMGSIKIGNPAVTGLLTTSHANSGKLNDVLWNVDWTALELDGMQVSLIGRQQGMPTPNTWHFDCGEITITYTPAAGGAVAGILKPKLQTKLMKHILGR